MISIIIPLYNKAPYIISTLQCVFQQTYTQYEIVVVDDGSTDDGVDRVESVNDDRIRIIRQKNGGVSAARNRGIAEARGEYVAFLDADDEWKPDYLSSQMELVRKYPQCSVFASNYEFRNVEGKVRNTIINKLPFAGTDGELSNYFEVACCSHPPLWTSAVMVRKTAIQEIGGFPVGIKSGEDLLTWARLAVKYKIAYSTKPLAVFVGLPSTTDVSKPKQRLSKEDKVLHGLQELYNDEQNELRKRQLKRYIFRWYKIQCVILLEVEMGWMCCKKAWEALLHGAPFKHFVPLIILGLLPQSIFIFLQKKRRR